MERTPEALWPNRLAELVQELPAAPARDRDLGLAQAFLKAGARSVLVSMRKVDDRATSLLMGRF